MGINNWWDFVPDEIYWMEIRQEPVGLKLPEVPTADGARRDGSRAGLGVPAVRGSRFAGLAR